MSRSRSDKPGSILAAIADRLIPRRSCPLRPDAACFRAHALPASAAAILLTGCATDQRRDVDAYRAVGDPPGSMIAPSPDAGLTLSGALSLAAWHNEQLAVVGEHYVQALAERQRIAAALRPTLSAFGDLALRENTDDSGVAQVDLGVNAQYRLLTGMSDLRTAEAGDASIESRRWLILDLRESLLVQTARAYYETLRAERLVGVLTSSVATQQERLDDARARRDVGFARPVDASLIEAQVARTRVQLISARRQAAEARSTLAFLTSADLTDIPLADAFELPAEVPGLDRLHALALAHRQDLLAARADADAARRLVDAAIGQFAPTLTVNLDYFLARDPDDTGSIVASLISLRVPLFSAGRIEADVRAAWSRFRERVLIHRARAREAARDVEIAQLRLRESRDRAAELAIQVAAATEALAQSDAAFEAGLGTNLERIVAQDQLLAAELEAASESFTTKTAYLELLRACGLLAHDVLGAPLPEPDDRSAPDAPVLDRDPPGGPAKPEATR